MAELDVDVAALAELRPGAPVAALVAAMGARWRPPVPRDQGWVRAATSTHGFTARLDINGRVGSLDFQEPFPATTPIAGLYLGMSARAACDAVPKLVMFHRAAAQGAEYSAAGLAGGCRLGAEFLGGKLHKIALFDLTARYPDKVAVPYPAPAGRPGDPFEDPNFKLVVLSSLKGIQAIDLGQPQDLAEFVLRRSVDLEKEGCAPIREAYDYLARYPLTDEDLAKVEALNFDGGNPIYRHFHYCWDGEARDYDVTSISGIARLTNLREFNHVSMLKHFDAAHLVGLNQLETLSFECGCRNPERLLELPALRWLTFHRHAIADASLIATFRQRGITVRVIG
ncbi:MAG: hypothetical protein K2Y71_02770 [Xanthobacteraceae bacterium]|nr:hypothetical protein [Xanthobacteraceae bacterium]